GETIGKIIEACLLDYVIDRVFTITVDNASANGVVIKYVKKKLSNWVVDGIILEGEFCHVRCCAHILNLIVTEVLKDILESIISIRNVVRYIAREVFAIQVSTVASESAFSTGGRTIDSFQSSMGAKTVEALICT
ncbi:hypothetical protein Ddye_020836, partial [Dipteronia dyeriana]